MIRVIRGLIFGILFVPVYLVSMVLDFLILISIGEHESYTLFDLFKEVGSYGEEKTKQNSVHS